MFAGKQGCHFFFLYGHCTNLYGNSVPKGIHTLSKFKYLVEMREMYYYISTIRFQHFTHYDTQNVLNISLLHIRNSGFCI